jgi:hypothetical protein
MAELVEEIAERTAAIVLERLGVATPTPPLVDAAALAEQLGVSRSWVYEHALELGGVPLGEVGEGRRPRWRFDVKRARIRLASCSPGRESEAGTSRAESGKQRGRPRRPLGTNTDLLPIRGEEGAA